MKKIIKCHFLILIISILITGCGVKEDVGNGNPIVYTSFYPVHDLVSSVAEDTLDVRTFMPSDKDPNLWEPTPKDMKKLSEAEFLVVNGANMEKWLSQVTQALPDLEVLKLSDGIELITYQGAAAIGDFQYMAGLDLEKDNYAIEFGHTHEDVVRVAFYHDMENLSEDKLIAKGKEIMEQKSKLVKQKSTIDIESDIVYGIEMGHEAGIVNFNIPKAGRWVFYSDRLSEEILSYELMDSKEDPLARYVYLEGSTSSLDKVTYDPHSWLSLVNAKSYIKDIEVELAKRYPDHARQYRKNRLDLIEEITDLEYEYKDKFKDLEFKEFVVTHYAYAYLARDFDLRQFPLQSLASMETPSLKTIKKALDFCQFYGVDTIFYEYGQQNDGAKNIAYDLGGTSVPLVSMEFINPQEISDDSTYVDLMRDNLKKIYESLR